MRQREARTAQHKETSAFMERSFLMQGLQVVFRVVATAAFVVALHYLYSMNQLRHLSLAFLTLVGWVRCEAQTIVNTETMLLDAETAFQWTAGVGRFSQREFECD